METMSIKKEAQEAIVGLLNKAIQVEYAVILNYPRMIDNLVEVRHIEDEQLNKDIETIGKDSFRHSGTVAQLIDQCGGECAWDVQVVSRLPDMQSMLQEQLKREKTAVQVYTEAKKIAEKNQTKAKTGGFLNKLLDKVETSPVNADEVIRTIDRIIMDEQRHIRLCEDSIATLEMLTN
jgi:rubrerythrin